MTLVPVDKLVIVGVGLIGGSFALALKEQALVRHVVGIGRSRENLDAALELTIIDEVADGFATVADAEIVLVAVPVGQMASIFGDLAPHLGEHTIVTDAGSTKQDVIAAARRGLGRRFSRFVPAHPIAGTEHSGARAAFPSLYRQRKVVLTREAETDPAAAKRVSDLWRACGADIRQMPAARHDAILAAVSHLPHLLAFALVDSLARRPEAEDLFAFAAGGFRDFTRIAASDPEMWRDISLANRDALRAELAAFRTQMNRLDALLSARDAAGLEELFATASRARRAWQGVLE